MSIGVGCISYFIVSYLYVRFRGLITTDKEERASFSCDYVSVRKGVPFRLGPILSSPEPLGSQGEH